jgi:cytochrome P450
MSALSFQLREHFSRTVPTGSSLPPGPTAPRLLQTLRFASRPLQTIEACARRWGDWFTLRLIGGRTNVFCSHPDAIRDVHAGDPDTFHAGEAAGDILAPLLGNHSLLVLDGERHLRERRLMSPPFHGERVHVYGRLVRESVQRVLAGWPLGRAFPIHHEMQTVTLDVILRAVFGIDDDPKLVDLRHRLEHFLALADGASAAFIVAPFLQVELRGLTPWGQYVRRARAIDELLYAEMARRRTQGTAGRSDILSLLLDARDEHGERMTDPELRDEMFTLLMAGHETTATSLAWAFYQVLRHPEVYRRLRDELHAVLGDGPLEPEHVSRLEYLDAVLKETQRLTPVVAFTGRMLRAPARIGGRDLPAGVIVSPAIYIVHRRPDLWPEPERFHPDRFLGVRPNPSHFFPFGGGVRRCLGAAFATYEMKMVLAEVLRRADLRIAPGYRMRRVQRAITYAPSRGMPVVMDARH